MIQRLTRVLIGVALGMGALILTVWILIHSLGTHDRLYRGKPLDYWVKQLASPEPAVSSDTRALVQTTVIPDLTTTLFNDTRDSKLRLALIDQLNALPGVNIYFIPADGRRAQAAGSLASLGTNAEAAIPDLIKAVKGKDEMVRVSAAKALGEIHCRPEAVIPLLIGCLDDSQDSMPSAAVEALGDFGALSRAALPKLVSLLKIPDKDLQRALRIALKQIDPEEAAKAGIK